MGHAGKGKTMETVERSEVARGLVGWGWGVEGGIGGAQRILKQ